MRSHIDGPCIYSNKDATRARRLFWEYFESCPLTRQRRLLLFISASDRIPATGISNLILRIQDGGTDEARYPTSHTCFNALVLPRYSTFETLRSRLEDAMDESVGFGLR